MASVQQVLPSGGENHCQVADKVVLPSDGESDQNGNKTQLVVIQGLSQSDVHPSNDLQQNNEKSGKNASVSHDETEEKQSLSDKMQTSQSKSNLTMPDNKVDTSNLVEPNHDTHGSVESGAKVDQPELATKQTFGDKKDDADSVITEGECAAMKKYATGVSGDQTGVDRCMGGTRHMEDSTFAVKTVADSNTAVEHLNTVKAHTSTHANDCDEYGTNCKVGMSELKADSKGDDTKLEPVTSTATSETNITVGDKNETNTEIIVDTDTKIFNVKLNAGTEKSDTDLQSNINGTNVAEDTKTVDNLEVCKEKKTSEGGEALDKENHNFISITLTDKNDSGEAGNAAQISVENETDKNGEPHAKKNNNNEVPCDAKNDRKIPVESGEISRKLVASSTRESDLVNKPAESVQKATEFNGDMNHNSLTQTPLKTVDTKTEVDAKGIDDVRANSMCQSDPEESCDILEDSEPPEPWGFLSDRNAEDQNDGKPEPEKLTRLEEEPECVQNSGAESHLLTENLSGTVSESSSASKTEDEQQEKLTDLSSKSSGFQKNKITSLHGDTNVKQQEKVAANKDCLAAVVQGLKNSAKKNMAFASPSAPKTDMFQALGLKAKQDNMVEVDKQTVLEDNSKIEIKSRSSRNKRKSNPSSIRRYVAESADFVPDTAILEFDAETKQDADESPVAKRMKTNSQESKVGNLRSQLEQTEKSMMNEHQSAEEEELSIDEDTDASDDLLIMKQTYMNRTGRRSDYDEKQSARIQNIRKMSSVANSTKATVPFAEKDQCSVSPKFKASMPSASTSHPLRVSQKTKTVPSHHGNLREDYRQSKPNPASSNHRTNQFPTQYQSHVAGEGISARNLAFQAEMWRRQAAAMQGKLFGSADGLQHPWSSMVSPQQMQMIRARMMQSLRYHPYMRARPPGAYPLPARPGSGTPSAWTGKPKPPPQPEPQPPAKPPQSHPLRPMKKMGVQAPLQVNDPRKTATVHHFPQQQNPAPKPVPAPDPLPQTARKSMSSPNVATKSMVREAILAKMNRDRMGSTPCSPPAHNFERRPSVGGASSSQTSDQPLDLSVKACTKAKNSSELCRILSAVPLPCQDEPEDLSMKPKIKTEENLPGKKPKSVSPENSQSSNIPKNGKAPSCELSGHVNTGSENGESDNSNFSLHAERCVQQANAMGQSEQHSAETVPETLSPQASPDLSAKTSLQQLLEKINELRNQEPGMELNLEEDLFNALFSCSVDAPQISEILQRELENRQHISIDDIALHEGVVKLKSEIEAEKPKSKNEVESLMNESGFEKVGHPQTIAVDTTAPLLEADDSCVMSSNSKSPNPGMSLDSKSPKSSSMKENVVKPAVQLPNDLPSPHLGDVEHVGTGTPVDGTLLKEETEISDMPEVDSKENKKSGMGKSLRRRRNVSPKKHSPLKILAPPSEEFVPLVLESPYDFDDTEEEMLMKKKYSINTRSKTEATEAVENAEGETEKGSEKKLKPKKKQPPRKKKKVVFEPEPEPEIEAELGSPSSDGELRLEDPPCCKICNKVFSQATSLKVHERIHTGAKPFECEFCDKSFRDLSTFKKHKRTHTGDRPYKCQICERSFTQSGNLLRHERRVHKFFGNSTVNPKKPPEALKRAHQALVEQQKKSAIKRRSNRPYLCNLCHCSFSTEDRLGEHYVTCHAEFENNDIPAKNAGQSTGNLLCVNCGSQFKTMIMLARHELKCKVQVKPFKCDDCLKKFTTGRALLHHRRAKHGKDKPSALEKVSGDDHKERKPTGESEMDVDEQANEEDPMDMSEMPNQSSEEEAQEFSDSLVGSDTIVEPLPLLPGFMLESRNPECRTDSPTSEDGSAGEIASIVPAVGPAIQGCPNCHQKGVPYGTRWP